MQESQPKVERFPAGSVGSELVGITALQGKCACSAVCWHSRGGDALPS